MKYEPQRFMIDITNFYQSQSTSLQWLDDPVLKKHNVSLAVLRCDLIHPEISGNKWFKLKYNLLSARKAKQDTLLSFGGAWSNHLHALSAAGKLFNFKTIGIVRGEENIIADADADADADAVKVSNQCLEDCVTNGMLLHSVSRSQYREKNSAEFMQLLHDTYGDFYLIPEGGANKAGIRGCNELLEGKYWQEFDQIYLPCGTATTLIGLITQKNLPNKKADVVGVQVLKGESYLQQETQRLLLNYALQETASWTILDDYHAGGYARSSNELMEFIKRFKEVNDIQLEPIYSGKVLYAIYDLLEKGAFPANSKLLAIHGGGLQGLRGFIKP